MNSRMDALMDVWIPHVDGEMERRTTATGDACLGVPSVVCDADGDDDADAIGSS